MRTREDILPWRLGEVSDNIEQRARRSDFGYYSSGYSTEKRSEAKVYKQ